ncbi:MAG: porin [Bacteroidales bacterium]
MKKLVCYLMFVINTSSILFAQLPNNSNDSTPDSKSIFESLTSIKKKSDKFNLYLNTHAGFGLKWQDEFEEGAFELKQLRLEMKGNINDWLSYRYRQRLNRPSNGSGNIDNLPTSIDVAGVGIRLSDKFSMFAGKQCAAYGGIEFDLNPISIYEYSDMIENMSNFLTGVNLAYDYNKQHQFQLQILNSRNNSSEDTYGNLEKAKLPLVYTFNWNGNFMDIFKPRWSVSVMNETKGKQMFYYALGNEFVVNSKFRGYFDWMYSREGVDRKGIITSIVGGDLSHNVLNTQYNSCVLYLNYMVIPKWHIFANGMYETASISNNTEGFEKGKYRTSFGYLGGVEYYPMKKSDLHFFLSYIGRSYHHTTLANMQGNDTFNTNRVSLGFIWQMPVF